MLRYTKRAINVFRGLLQSEPEDTYSFYICNEKNEIVKGGIDIQTLKEWRDELNLLIKDHEEEEMAKKL